ncbi:MAG: prepilin-type N-terminal cleavage/methylation domain-containing protein [Pseudomonadota bacterium]
MTASIQSTTTPSPSRGGGRGEGEPTNVGLNPPSSPRKRGSNPWNFLVSRLRGNDGIGSGRRVQNGFTLIELLVVLSVIALLLTLAAPRYFQHIDRAKEAVLKENLATMRDAIDQYHADTNTWPDSLPALVERHYLRAVPKDPITDSDQTWQEIPATDGGQGVYDVKSGAEGAAADGRAYAEW